MTPEQFSRRDQHVARWCRAARSCVIADGHARAGRVAWASIPLALLLPFVVIAQGTPAATPRFADGTVNLGAMRGETGHGGSHTLLTRE